MAAKMDPPKKKRRIIVPNEPTIPVTARQKRVAALASKKPRKTPAPVPTSRRQRTQAATASSRRGARSGY